MKRLLMLIAICACALAVPAAASAGTECSADCVTPVTNDDAKGGDTPVDDGDKGDDETPPPPDGNDGDDGEAPPPPDDGEEGDDDLPPGALPGDDDLLEPLPDLPDYIGDDLDNPEDICAGIPNCEAATAGVNSPPVGGGSTLGLHRGGGYGLPYTGPEDMIIPMILALITVAGGLIAYRRAGDWEIVDAAKRRAMRRQPAVQMEPRHVSAYGGAVNRMRLVQQWTRRQ